MASSPNTGTIDGKDGLKLFYRWNPAAEPKGAVLIVHGLAEHSGRYAHVMAALNERGYSCLGLDLRGHGQSEGRRVFVKRFSDYTDDVGRAVTLLRTKQPEGPVFLLGHSMGGLIALLAGLANQPALTGLVLSSPGIRSKIHVPAWKDLIGKLMSKVWPTLSIPTGIAPSDVSRDPEVVKAYDADPLVTKNATARWYTEFLVSQDAALRGARALKIPTLILGAGRDRLVDAEAYHQLIAALGSKDKTLESYPELFHEVFNEPEKDAVLSDLAGWLDAHIG